MRNRDELRTAAIVQSRARKELDRMMLTLPPEKLGELGPFRQKYDEAYKRVRELGEEC
jgi:hypothetical protein